MAYLTYESIEINPVVPVKAFIASIAYTPFHWHREYELIGVLSGEIMLRDEEGTAVLKKGDIYLLNPNTIHEIHTSGTEGNLCMLVQIDPGFLKAGVGEDAAIHFYLDSTREELAPECGFDSLYKRMAKIVYYFLDDKKTSIYRVGTEVFALVSDLLEYVVYDRFIQTKAESEALAHTVELIEYLDRNKADSDVVENACRHFGFSRKTLDRTLQAATQLTGREMEAKLRINEAKHLLRNTDKNMNYILDVCGFGSENTFYRIFKKETGMTPKEYRERGQRQVYNEAVNGYLDYEDLKAKQILRDILKEDL